jgi:hypothetical protein
LKHYALAIFLVHSVVLASGVEEPGEDKPLIHEREVDDICSKFWAPFNGTKHKTSAACCGIFNSLPAANSEANCSCFNKGLGPNTRFTGSCCNSVKEEDVDLRYSCCIFETGMKNRFYCSLWSSSKAENAVICGFHNRAMAPSEIDGCCFNRTSGRASEVFWGCCSDTKGEGAKANCCFNKAEGYKSQATGLLNYAKGPESRAGCCCTIAYDQHAYLECQCCSIAIGDTKRANEDTCITCCRLSSGNELSCCCCPNKAERMLIDDTLRGAFGGPDRQKMKKEE